MIIFANIVNFLLTFYAFYGKLYIGVKRRRNYMENRKIQLEARVAKVKSRTHKENTNIIKKIQRQIDGLK